MEAFFEFGSPTRTRTRDILINSQSLYQLSYRGIVGTSKCAAGFWSSTRSKSSRYCAFYSSYRLLQGLHRTCEGQAQVAGRPKCTARHDSDVSVIDEIAGQGYVVVKPKPANSAFHPRKCVERAFSGAAFKSIDFIQCCDDEIVPSLVRCCHLADYRLIAIECGFCSYLGNAAGVLGALTLNGGHRFDQALWSCRITNAPAGHRVRF